MNMNFYEDKGSLGRERRAHRHTMLSTALIYGGSTVTIGVINSIPGILPAIVQNITFGAFAFLGLTTAYFFGRYYETFWRP